MSDLSELEQRVTELERRVGMESGLRASGDRDLSDLDAKVRAMHHIVQALAITQSEHTRMHEITHAKLDQIIAMLEGLS